MLTSFTTILCYCIIMSGLLWSKSTVRCFSLTRSIVFPNQYRPTLLLAARGLSSTGKIRHSDVSPSQKPFSAGPSRDQQPTTRKFRPPSNSKRRGSASRAVKAIDAVQSDCVRINKCLPSLSRRAADEAVAAGRVRVNGEIVTHAGFKVQPGDKVYLDEKKQNWESKVQAQSDTSSSSLVTDFDEQDFIYIKYWKPMGVITTSNLHEKGNVIQAGGFQHFPQRVFSVGRLDKDTSGLLLLTSDGRLPTSLLEKGATQHGKVYDVSVNRTLTEGDLHKLRDGLLITTPVQREKHAGQVHFTRFITAKTLPCKVKRLASNRVEMVLFEGRNRQIRRMMQALGCRVTGLHRVSFAGITLQGLHQPGDWQMLSKAEMRVVQRAIEKRQEREEMKLLNPSETERSEENDLEEEEE